MNQNEEIQYSFKEEFLKILKPTPTTILILIPLFIIQMFFIKFANLNIYQSVSFIGLSFFLLLTSIQDFNDKEVFEFLLAPTAIFSTFYITEPNSIYEFSSLILNNILVGLSIVAMMFFISNLLAILLNKETLGDGDYPLLYSMGIVLGLGYVSYGFIVMALSALLYMIVTRDKTVPLIPFINIAITVVLFYSMVVK